MPIRFRYSNARIFTRVAVEFHSETFTRTRRIKVEALLAFRRLDAAHLVATSLRDPPAVWTPYYGAGPP